MVKIDFTKETEEDVKFQYITPAIQDAGWTKEKFKFEFAFTDGRMQIKGNKGVRDKRKKADYILLYDSTHPMAVVEAKDGNHGFSDGIQQALDYCEILDIPFAYSSNGKSFFEQDTLTGKTRELAMNEFPSPDELWQRYKDYYNISPEVEEIITEPDYYNEISKKKPRYYQRIAINKTLEAIAKGENRILLVMATGTGKTFTAFQIAYKLWNSGIKKKILYLADRNILIDQTMQQDFKPFEDVMTKITHKKLDSSYEMYFSLYQQLVTNNEGQKQPYEEFSPDFFDLIIVDECHRGSAKEDSQWRQILEYFSSATQIGMTATPKEDNEVSTSSYFKAPLYTYSLKQGIEDGFLAPYYVKRVYLDVDGQPIEFDEGARDENGKLLEPIYTPDQYEKEIVIKKRTPAIAKIITDFLKKSGDRFAKTIVFCVDQEHAQRMRNAIADENQDLVAENYKYVMRITSDDYEGKRQLDYFIEPDEKYPTIVTTSDLLSTGVDCKTCKLIVLDNNISSMTKFKQIIGRGTRLREDYGKYYFTIMDFRGNVRKFEDPEFDGDPEPSSEPPKGGKKKKGKKSKDSKKREKVFVDGINVGAILEKNYCIGEDGKIITHNFIAFSKKNILNQYRSLEDFINHWNELDKKEAIERELYEHDVFLKELREEVDSEDLDDFDLICQIAYDKKPLTRSERANNVKKRKFLDKYEGITRKVLEGLLDKYATAGIRDLENIEFLDNEPFRQYGSPMKIAKEFGGKPQLQNAIQELQKEIYIE
jgi:type I restriction enzyme R subunit